MSEQDERWITVAVAAEATGRSEGWIYAAIRDHKLRVDHAKNAKGMRLQLVLRDEVIALSENSRGHLSDRALYVDRAARDDSSHASVDDPADSHDDITSRAVVPNGRADKQQLDITSHKPLLGYREVAWGLAGIAWQQGREVERLRAELDAERDARRVLSEQIGEERGRRQAAEQRAADAEARARRGLWARLVGRG